MKKISRVAILSSIATFSAPLLAFAQTGINTAAITPYSDRFIYVVNNVLVPLLVATAFIVFLYGVFRYFILGGADEGDRETGRQFILWGLIGFVVILSVWGIVNLLLNTFGLTAGTTAPPAPTFGPSTGTGG